MDRALIRIVNILIISLFIFLTLSCGQRKTEEVVICTQIPANGSTDQVYDNRLYPDNSRLVAFKLDNPEKTFRILTDDFYSATSPDVFYTGHTLVFSAQKNEGDVWQIWEMNLNNFKTTQITSVTYNCSNPVYLPTGDILFSGEIKTESQKEQALFTCKNDGSEVQQITFHPHLDFAPAILLDGRVLFVSQQLEPTKGEQKIMAMRPDGTKLELFYQGNKGNKITGRGWETADGEILFTQIQNNTGNGELISVGYNNPFGSVKNLSSEIEGSILSVFPLESGENLISLKMNNESSYGIYTFNSGSKNIDKPIYTDKAYHTFNAVLNKVKNRARKLPSAVDKYNNTGLILCQDINASGIAAKADIDSPVKVEILGTDKLLGKVEAESDGSVYLKIEADTPFRYRIVNENGETVRGPSDWLWVRPNERRGCVGCHADRELTPKNRVPLAVKKEPISIPEPKEVVKAEQKSEGK